MSSHHIENAQLAASLERDMQPGQEPTRHRVGILPLLKDTFASSAGAINGFVDFVIDGQTAMAQSHKKNPSPSM
jgi:hypothetical protein